MSLDFHTVVLLSSEPRKHLCCVSGWRLLGWFCHCLLLYRWLLLWAWTCEHICVWRPPPVETFVSTFRILTRFSVGICQNWSTLSLLSAVKDSVHRFIPSDSTGQFLYHMWYFYPFAVIDASTSWVSDMDVICCSHWNREKGWGETFGSRPCEKTAWICWGNQRQPKYFPDGYFVLPLPLPISVWVRVRMCFFMHSFNLIIKFILMVWAKSKRRDNAENPSSRSQKVTRSSRHWGHT